ISRDCQELEPSIGEQLASLLYLEPDSELMAMSLAAESKREEEKAKGVNPENGGENPDIVPFEDNEEEEEEESEEEEENFGVASHGRGRGRGMMWPPQMPLARGARPIPGMRGFPPGMMGADGFSYGPVTPDGFGIPDLFSVGPRAFGPYGPRFSGDFTGPMSGMLFHGRPPQPGAVFPPGGFGMMMGPGRPSMMGGIGPTAASVARAGRPVNMPPMFQPPPPHSQNTARAAKRDQRMPTNDRNERFSTGPEQGRSQDVASTGAGPDDDTQCQQNGSRFCQDDQFASGNNTRNEESESEDEDEAPRRSRHGEGKKKRRSSEEDVSAFSDH
ncbi:30-kDa cleavage and polyadenylation specificity factor 30-like, partial [Carica papaya]|uniref:30-kDa cleavage and polyadenylation specificity factor 30-like n=1 Tax=Carica papaya TaxID=3649 RepID=UPI000B8C8834